MDLIPVFFSSRFLRVLPFFAARIQSNDLTVWVLLGFGFRFYMDRFGFRGYDRMYGALGGVAILLLLFYVDALVLLIGAEINSEIDFEVLKVRRGTHDLRRAEDMDSAT